ncbi:PsbP-related protein [Ascidiimonas sp. W6]|uniref:PsbP-related protein n=1 Tax=Ascidiimonas meishanensis TaxID=3128903 RepID=UPI0030ECE37A
MRLFTFKNSGFFFLGFLLLFKFSYAQAVEDKLEITTLKKARYTISYPNNWIADDSGDNGIELLLRIPSTKGNTRFNSNISILIQDITGFNLDLKGYTDASLKQLKKRIPTIKILVNERKKVGSYHMQRLIYLINQGEGNLKFEQRYWVIGNQAYAITATYLDKKESSQEATIKAVLNTFTPIVKE